MEIVAFTEEVADLRVRYQITYMKDSVMIWVQPASDQTNGSLPCLSVAMPRAIGTDALPPATTLIGAGADAVSQGIAQKISKRCDIVIWACVDLPEGGSVIEEVVYRRLLQELERKGLGGRDASPVDGVA